MAIYKNLLISEKFLNMNLNSYFVFGDNIIREGMGGAAALRYHSRAIGFITKKYPDNKTESFYRPEEYSEVFFEELKKLKTFIEKNPNNIFYISQLGAGLANKYRIWQKLICHNLVKTFENFDNVVFCWTDNLN